jgi:hypothetical protein
MKRALFFVYLVTHFIELVRVARMLRDEGGYECVFLFAHRYPSSARDLDTCRQEGFACIDDAGRPIEPGDAEGRTGGASRAIGSRIARILKGATIGELILTAVFPRLASWTSHYRNELQLAGTTMDKVKPSVLILPEDSVEFATASLVRAARARGIPSVIVPFTISNAEESAEARWHDSAFSLERWRNRVVGRFKPHWVLEHRGKHLLALAADRALAMEMVGLAPPQPWVVNSGRADAIAVESPFMEKYYLASGLPRAQLVVTGALYDDMLAARLANRQERRAALIQELALDPEKSILVCALPPDQSDTRRPNVEFATYGELLRAWGDALANAKGFTVVLKHHPRTPGKDVAFLQSERGLRLAEDEIVDLISLCDVYAAYASATIRLAIACGTPVIHYDCHRFHYSDYLGVPGVLTTYDLPGFRRALQELADPQAREALASRQRQFAAQSNILDGRAGERMLALVNGLTSAAGTSPGPRA